MKNIIIKDECNHRVISGNAVSILEKLPTAIFELSFLPQKGFSLNEVDGFFKNSEKLYGQVETITEKVLHTFDVVDRNLGVLFSGPKGLGKSLAVRNICKEALKKGFPVILVKENFDNTAQFIETICQPSVIVFDEFEKMYMDNCQTEKDELEVQNNLLNLFDSFLEGKKLFLLTCNEIREVSEYLLNRPGRLHYHFKMNRLTISEITEYCKDKLAKEQHSLIHDICLLGARIPDFSYDMLRSILFELNVYKCGLEEVRRVLNIEARARSPFNFTIHFKSGKTGEGFDYIDTSQSHQKIEWYNKTDGSRCFSTANMLCAQWTRDANGSLLLDGEYVFWQQSEENENNNDCIENIIFVPAKND